MRDGTEGTTMDKTSQIVLNKKTRMAGIDVITSIVIMAASIATAIISMQLPRPGGWESAPGIMPLLFSVTLFLMGLGLFFSALRRNGISILIRMLSGLSAEEFFGDVRTKRTLWIILLTGTYIFILSGQLPFEIAGSVFLLSTLAIFWKKGGKTRIILISFVIPLFFGFVIRVLFSNLLPGDSIFDRLL